ncbi:MAG: hypothetical protein M1281_05005 [Chloroflexi bacterium]|nr:hypothetical protein [Chloroflexota bacterium]
MANGMKIYVCPQCFCISETPGRCHDREMLCCAVGKPGDRRRRPVMDGRGRIWSRAPRWFLEASGWVQAGPRYTPLVDCELNQPRISAFNP